ncbi:MAG TPA: TonB-dependent receptor, partial [Pasteurellaceae bacterium]|nr:TonB-dependent receptor [Pasteurellaceae bacterium]
EIKGVETQARYKYDNLSASISYARARSTQKSNGYYAFPDSGDRYILGLSYYVPESQVELGWNSLWVRTINLPDTTPQHKESYSVSNAYVSWSPRQVKGLELTFGVDNIFNEAYKDHSSQYYTSVDLDPGRNYKLAVSYKF